MWKNLGINAKINNQEWKVNLIQDQILKCSQKQNGLDYLDPYTFLSLGITNAGNNHHYCKI